MSKECLHCYCFYILFLFRIKFIFGETCAASHTPQTPMKIDWKLKRNSQFTTGATTPSVAGVNVLKKYDTFLRGLRCSSSHTKTPIHFFLTSSGHGFMNMTVNVTEEVLGIFFIAGNEFWWPLITNDSVHWLFPWSCRCMCGFNLVFPPSNKQHDLKFDTKIALCIFHNGVGKPLIYEASYATHEISKCFTKKEVFLKNWFWRQSSIFGLSKLLQNCT